MPFSTEPETFISSGPRLPLVSTQPTWDELTPAMQKGTLLKGKTSLKTFYTIPEVVRQDCILNVMWIFWTCNSVIRLLTDLISLPKERLFTLKKVQKQKQIFHVTQSRFPEWKPLWSTPSPYSLSHARSNYLGFFSHQEVKLLIQTLLLIRFHIPMHALVFKSDKAGFSCFCPHPSAVKTTITQARTLLV